MLIPNPTPFYKLHTCPFLWGMVGYVSLECEPVLLPLIIMCTLHLLSPPDPLRAAPVNNFSYLGRPGRSTHGMAMSDTSTKTCNGRVQSGGWMTGACVNIIFKVLIASTSISFHLNGVRCTAPCKGVPNSARYRNIRLCHLIFPRNLLRAFGFFGVAALIIAFIFPGSTTTPSLLKIWSSSVSLITPNAHFVGFRLSLVDLHFSRHSWRWLR